MKNKTKKIWHPEMWIAFFAICGFLVVLSVANATYITTALRPLNVGLPTANTNAATKAYVDTTVAAAATSNQYAIWCCFMSSCGWLVDDNSTTATTWAGASIIKFTGTSSTMYHYTIANSSYRPNCYWKKIDFSVWGND